MPYYYDETNIYSIIMFTQFMFNIMLTCDYVLIDQCVSNPCVNGANCTDGYNDYTCACVAGYTGKNCEKGERIGVSSTNILYNYSCISACVYTL